ncbi:hypothetical protein ISCGN_006822 [Ixodes scapularis]
MQLHGHFCQLCRSEATGTSESQSSTATGGVTPSCSQSPGCTAGSTEPTDDQDPVDPTSPFEVSAAFLAAQRGAESAHLPRPTPADVEEVTEPPAAPDMCLGLLVFGQ